MSKIVFPFGDLELKNKKKILTINKLNANNFENCEHNFFSFFSFFYRHSKNVQLLGAFLATFSQQNATQNCTDFRQQTRDHVCNRVSQDVCNFVTIAKIGNKPR